MLTNFRKEQKKIIFIDDQPIGFFLDFVIDSKNAKIMGFWLETLKGQKIVLPENIINWDENKITINSYNSLKNPQKIPILNEVFSREFPIISAKVFFKKKYLGIVKNFIFDTISSRIMNISVKKGWWIFGNEKIISVQNIEKITNKGIFVLSDLTKIFTQDEIFKKKNKTKKSFNPEMDKNIDK